MGDKLHELARLSPTHVLAFGLLLDQTLEKVRAERSYRQLKAAILPADQRRISS